MEGSVALGGMLLSSGQPSSISDGSLILVEIYSQLDHMLMTVSLCVSYSIVDPTRAFKQQCRAMPLCKFAGIISTRTASRKSPGGFHQLGSRFQGCCNIPEDPKLLQQVGSVELSTESWHVLADLSWV